MSSDEPTGFEAARRTVTTLLPVIDGIEAEGFLADLAEGLGTVAGLRDLRLRKTRDPLCRFEATASFAGWAGDVAASLGEAWARRLANGAEESHRLTVTDDEVALDFLTWIPERWHATGRVVATRAPR